MPLITQMECQKCVHTWWKLRVRWKLNGSLKHLLIKVKHSYANVCNGFSFIYMHSVNHTCFIFLSQSKTLFNPRSERCLIY